MGLSNSGWERSQPLELRNPEGRKNPRKKEVGGLPCPRRPPPHRSPRSDLQAPISSLRSPRSDLLAPPSMNLRKLSSSWIQTKRHDLMSLIPNFIKLHGTELGMGFFRQSSLA
ncbi:hypothetical protein LINPERPRIM_LOCUS11026 [Linum perenne]